MSKPHPALVQIKTESQPGMDVPPANDDGAVQAPAGEFSEWLRTTIKSLRARTGGVNVPCGSCTACCRSSMFIHICPEETETLRQIPRALLFAAPGLPKGHVLMGYNEAGHCPMLIDNKCSIYAHRPQTCRDYDCRIFPATGIAVDAELQPEIERRVRDWAFGYENQESREEHSLLQKTARFLLEKKELFTPGALPSNPAQLAVLAVRVYRRFAEMESQREEGVALADAVIAQGITAELANAKPMPQKGVSEDHGTD